MDLDEDATFEVEKLVADVSVNDYDALPLPGGTVNPDQLRMNSDAVRFVKAPVDSGKPVAAICHGPSRPSAPPSSSSSCGPSTPPSHDALGVAPENNLLGCYTMQRRSGVDMFAKALPGYLRPRGECGRPADARFHAGRDRSTGPSGSGTP